MFLREGNIALALEDMHAVEDVDNPSSHSLTLSQVSIARRSNVIRCNDR